MYPSFFKIFFPAAILLILLLPSCKKNVHPEMQAGLIPGRITFLNLSEDLQLEVSQSIRYSQFSYVLIDNPDTNYVKTVEGFDEMPYFSQERPMQYPIADIYNIKQDQPWIKYQWLTTGDHQLILTDTGRHPVVRLPVNISADNPLTVWYMDSLGQYRGAITRDHFQSKTGQVDLRVVDASPDAGPVFFTINQEPAKDFPDTLKYGTISSFIQRSVTVADTLRLRFYSVADSSTVLTRTTLVVQPEHAYTIVLTGYYQSNYYINPYSGKPVWPSPDLRILLFKNN
ncbi:hypothetical protein ACX0G9_22270 [Flavitalea flava]